MKQNIRLASLKMLGFWKMIQYFKWITRPEESLVTDFKTLKNMGDNHLGIAPDK